MLWIYFKIFFADSDAEYVLRRAFQKSKIDILKTFLTVFFADSGAEYVT